jgi:hypothetical protein
MLRFPVEEVKLWPGSPNTPAIQGRIEQCSLALSEAGLV